MHRDLIWDGYSKLKTIPKKIKLELSLPTTKYKKAASLLYAEVLK
jgi:hypothetical protein